jgi:ABC-2 type transport system ATP-binding protein
VTAGAQLLGVGRRFGRVLAIEDISFEIAAGEVLGLLGPNGAGKTTTMRVLTGYLRPSAGRVLVDGVDLLAEPVAARQRIGYVPESAAVPGEMSVVGFLRYCARLRRVPRAKRKAAVAQAIGQAGLPRVAGQRIGTLSRGYRQRVALAQALVHDPPVLVLDEPTSGLDPRQVAETRDLIARLGRSRAVLLSSHLLTEVGQLCRRVVVLDRGRMLAVSDVAELTAVTGVQRLELRLAGDLDRAAALLAGIEGVTESRARGGVVVVRGEGHDLGPRVSAAVVAAGIGLLELRATTGTLEEAYLRLVRE